MQSLNHDLQDPVEGILLVNKPPGKTSFSLVASLRKRIGVKKIGHAGTLDPFATGVMVMLIGRAYTRLSDKFLEQDKEYLAELFLGVSTDTHDCEGQVLERSGIVPSMDQILNAIAPFQGEFDQVPPMYSAKKINGKKLYELARKGKTVERQPVKVHAAITVLSYAYPRLVLKVACSKGTYIRTLAHDIGERLGSWAHLTGLQRVRSGSFHLKDCIDGLLLDSTSFDRAACHQCIITDIKEACSQ